MAWTGECLDCGASHYALTLAAGFDWVELHEAEVEHICRMTKSPDPFVLTETERDGDGGATSSPSG